MADLHTIDISRIVFSSTVFPTTEDRALWERLDAAQRLAVLRRDEQAGFESGVAENTSMEEVLHSARRGTDL
jgi:hypothetical protein